MTSATRRSASAVAVVAIVSSKANSKRKSNRPRLSHLPTIPPLYGAGKPAAKHRLFQAVRSGFNASLQRNSSSSIVLAPPVT